MRKKKSVASLAMAVYRPVIVALYTYVDPKSQPGLMALFNID